MFLPYCIKVFLYLQKLVDFGSHPSPVTLSGSTPADLAGENGHQQTQKYLKKESQPEIMVGIIHRTSNAFDTFLIIK